MALYISGDGVVEYLTVDLYWGQSSRIWCFRSLLRTVWSGTSLKISTGEVVVGNGAIDLYLGRNGRVWCC